ncbi:MAG: hypothetical protein EOS32_18315, partial [Mesorhizobium sp.]
MDAIEKAIRNAFEKGNAEDRLFRERVYRSAFAALDRVLQANPNVTVEMAIKRRKAVQAKIAEIESEFLPAVPDVAALDESDTAAAVAPEIAVSAETAAPAPTVEPPTQAAPGQPSPAIVVDGPVQPSASDAPRSRVLPVVPDIMPGDLPDAPTLDSPASAAAEDGEAEVAPDRD